MTGKEIAGDGGRFSFRLDLVSKNLAKIIRKRKERIKVWVKSILVFFVFDLSISGDDDTCGPHIGMRFGRESYHI